MNEWDLIKKYDVRLMFRNLIDESKNWKNWIPNSKCSNTELKQANLRELFPNEIVLDIEEKKRITEIANLLKEQGFKYFVYDTGSRGIHIHLYFNNLEMFDKEHRKEIRKLFIKEFNCDESKASDSTLISINNRPHHKTMKPKVLLEQTPGDNTLNGDLIIKAKQIILKNQNNNISVADELFKDYHTKDLFFSYIKNNNIPDDTSRNDIIFPNIAIALVKEGLNKKEIEEIMKPIIRKNFKGKNYNEFNGWLTKAFRGEIDTYNTIQLNKWGKEFANLEQEFYDVKSESVEILDTQSSEEGIKFYWDEDLKDIKDTNINWLVEKWIPQGDICFVAGKAASYKTTAILHICYCIANNLPVFQEFSVIPSKVLYINEENSNPIFLSNIKRIKKGLNLENGNKNLSFTLLQNIRFEKLEQIDYLIKFILEHNIKVIVFDSFRRFFLGDENEARLINKIFNLLKYIRNKTGTTIIVIHHHKKSNAKDGVDIRDLLRGSSDIVNSADSVIGIHRKHGCMAFKMEHIKNRAGEEIPKKLIQIDSGENKDSCYMYQSKDLEAEEKAMSLPEKCAENIIKLIEVKNITKFKRGEIEKDLNFSYDTITKGLRILIEEGTLISIGKGKGCIYSTP